MWRELKGWGLLERGGGWGCGAGRGGGGEGGDNSHDVKVRYSQHTGKGCARGEGVGASQRWGGGGGRQGCYESTDTCCNVALQEAVVAGTEGLGPVEGGKMRPGSQCHSQKGQPNTRQPQQMAL